MRYFLTTKNLLIASLLSISVFHTNPVAATETQDFVLKNIITTQKTSNNKKIKLPLHRVKVIASTLELKPGKSFPIHKHPFQRYTYILSGTLQSTEVETNKVNTYKEGSFIVEPSNVFHYISNIGTDTLKVLFIDQIKGKAETNVIFQKNIRKKKQTVKKIDQKKVH